MFEKKSFTTFKKEELFDQLLSSVEEQIWGSSKEQFHPDRPLWLVFSNDWNKHRDLELSAEERLHLTRPPGADERPRLTHLGACRDWAMTSENWARMIPEAKELLLECAREHKRKGTGVLKHFISGNAEFLYAQLQEGI